MAADPGCPEAEGRLRRSFDFDAINSTEGEIGNGLALAILAPDRYISSDMTGGANVLR